MFYVVCVAITCARNYVMTDVVSLGRTAFVIDVTPRSIVYLVTAPGLAVSKALGIVLVITDLNTLT
jgi:hypothetical protein